MFSSSSPCGQVGLVVTAPQTFSSYKVLIPSLFPSDLLLGKLLGVRQILKRDGREDSMYLTDGASGDSGVMCPIS